MLIKKLQDSGEDTSIITKWYQKDTNAVPPVHVLQPISSLIPDYKAKVSEQSCICVLGVSILPLSMIFLFDFGIVPTVELFGQCGIVLTVWNCLDSVELFRQCGIVWTVWNCSNSVVLFQQCGIVWTVWNCSDSVELFGQCGIVGTVWNCSDSVELFRQCGIFGFPFYYFIKYLQVKNTCTAPSFYLGGGIWTYKTTLSPASCFIKVSVAIQESDPS